jgi:hypothetical protein
MLKQVRENCKREEIVIYFMVPLFFGENMKRNYLYICSDLSEVGTNP